MRYAIEQSLLKKYDISGPRYTSYPTALQFTPAFNLENYHQHVKLSNDTEQPKPLSLYVHIPFCKSLCYYCGCHKVITQNRERVSSYIHALLSEINLQSKIFGDNRTVKQLHFGGGTPTYLSTSEIGALVCALRRQFNFAMANNCEMGIEIDPRTTTTDDIETLVRMGFNRMSFGVQDFTPEVQTAINRIQDKQSTLSLLDAARAAGAESLSVDLIYGLPMQSLDSFCNTLHDIIQASPDRIALYNYAHMPNLIKSQRLINVVDLPASETKLAILDRCIKMLTAAGYKHIGMDHFSRPEDPLSQQLESGGLHRNFQGYSTHGDCDIIGFGASAISKIGHSYSQNQKDLKDYKTTINSGKLPTFRGYALTEDDKIRAAVIQSIMCSRKLDFDDFYENHGIIFTRYFAKELKKLSDFSSDKLLEIHYDSIEITEKGRPFIRNIAMTFDAYNAQNLPTENTQRYSKVL